MINEPSGRPKRPARWAARLGEVRLPVGESIAAGAERGTLDCEPADAGRCSWGNSSGKLARERLKSSARNDCCYNLNALFHLGLRSASVAGPRPANKASRRVETISPATGRPGALLAALCLLLLPLLLAALGPVGAQSWPGAEPSVDTRTQGTFRGVLLEPGVAGFLGRHKRGQFYKMLARNYLTLISRAHSRRYPLCERAR